MNDREMGGSPDEAAAPEQGTKDGDWLAGLGEAERKVVAAKGWRSPAEVIRSYVNLERRLGAAPERLLALPAQDDDETAWGEVFDRLGRPASPEGYSFDDGERSVDPEIDGWYRTAAHAAGLSSRQADRLRRAWHGFADELEARRDRERAERAESDLKSLEREWGAAYPQRLAAAREAAASFADPSVLGALEEGTLGPAGMVKLFAEIGQAMAEDVSVAGVPGGLALATEEAQAEIARFETENREILADRAHPRHPAVSLERSALYRRAFPD